MKEDNRVNLVMLFQRLDMEHDLELQHTIKLASKLFDTPVSSINLIGKDKQWIKTNIGLDLKETTAELSFCKHTIKSNKVLVVNDTLNDTRFVDHPNVVAFPQYRFYAGAPLITRNGYRIGALCVMDYKPHTLNKQQVSLLKLLSEHVVSLMESKISLSELGENFEKQNIILSKIAEIHSHEYRRPITSIMGLISLMEHEDFIASREYLTMLKKAALELDAKTRTIMNLINDLRAY
jgi:GAF domain-containing protein